MQNERMTSHVSFSTQWIVFGVYPRSGTEPDALQVADIPDGSCRVFGADPEMNPVARIVRKHEGNYGQWTTYSKSEPTTCCALSARPRDVRTLRPVAK